MPKRFTFMSVIAICSALALPAAAESVVDADTVVARVNGEDITLAHMIIARATLPEQYQQVPADVLYNAILDQLIQQTALMQSRDAEVPDQVRVSLENERRSLLAAAAIETVMTGVGSDEEIRAAYDAKYADGFGETEYDASHILVETEEEAQAIKAELDGGADFAETAKAKSTGPSGPNGGNLGWFADGAMVAEFQAAVNALAAGEISDPVQTQFGWHIIVLNESRKKTAPELDVVRNELLQKLRQDAVEARIEDLTRNADIERPVIDDLNPEILLDLGLVGN
ncbi:peptidylprolyl isomerase [Sedimentitalea sp. JM2-8]|uniref:Parvulin-like PPIase n=1 Tax=Sedimentitalea xiamensis TaxID=3050037 RepID=A0ABT7FA51_9RHOB|nr:peptidylprolyl isomerase [Sedimentitalea xiamensis]MDK3071729.1 peptidylprolyl isomerase [Sedimentitalea xiamensis]